MTTELFSATELTARRLIEEYRTAQGRDIPMTDVALLNVWIAKWSAALSVAQVGTLSDALNAMSIPAADVAATLTKMTRAKLLRSFTSQGVRYYEVNF
jgi:hypothetical protein